MQYGYLANKKNQLGGSCGMPKLKQVPLISWTITCTKRHTHTPKGERRNGTVAGVYNSNISRLCGFRIQRTIYTAVVPKNILKQKPSILQTGRLGLSKVDLWCNSFLSSGATGPLLWQLDPKIPGNTVPKPGRCHAHTNPQQN